MSSALTALCLAGPTGSGKTDVALHLATVLNGEVINTDSRQVYKHFPIITAQPNAAEMATCPHHLYGFLDTQEKLSAGQWADKAIKAANTVIASGKLPIFVGGTGLYFKTILEGIAQIPSVPKHISHIFIERCKEEGSKSLHQELMQCDSAYAMRIHPNDSQRIVRALEVFAATGKTFSWWHEHAMPTPPVNALYLGINMSLDDLTPRLGARIESMMEAGALQEATTALKHCDDKNAPAWSGIGCAELYAHLCEGVSLPQSIELWRKNTRAYAKRQLTWFRAVKNINWYLAGDAQGMLDKAKHFLLKNM